MRLTAFEVNAIKQSAQEVFGSNVQVFLFGSRVDDAKRINSAYLKMSVFMPLDAKRYQQLTDDEIEHID